MRAAWAVVAVSVVVGCSDPQHAGLTTEPRTTQPPTTGAAVAPSTEQTTSAPPTASTVAAPTTSPATLAETTTVPSPTTATPTSTVPPDPLPPVAQLANLQLSIVDVADLQHPLAFAWRPGDDGAYIADQGGLVHRLGIDGNVETVLDITARVTKYENGSERGLLGLAFGPDGRMYLDFTDQQSDTHVVSMAMDGNTPDPATEWEILFIDQPGFGHKAGTLAFDAAGNLYIASGDGAGSSGRDAQDPSKLLGAILRVKPNAEGPGYTIPADNPFANDPVVRPEKWVFGLRNPWRFSIDDDTGDMWLGDVGNDDVEEIDRIPAGTSGLNFGWYWYEGSTRRRGGAPDDLVPPVFEYTHQTGVSAIGGHVYRGTAIPALRGAYVFGDLTGIMWAFGGDGVQVLPLRFESLVAFGEAPDGELWLAGHFGRIARLAPA